VSQPLAHTSPNRLHALEQEIRDRCADTARSLWQIGQSLLTIRDEELWRQDGHRSFDAWLDAGRIPMSRVSGYKAMRIAEHFGGEMAARFGTEKLDAALSYLQATRRDEQPGDLLGVQIRTRGDDGQWGAVPFVQATATQIRRAAAELGTKRQHTRLPKDLQVKVAELNQALRAHRGAHAAPKVRLQRDKGGRLVLAMEAVAVEDLPAFLEALQTYLLVEGQGAGPAGARGEAGPA